VGKISLFAAAELCAAGVVLPVAPTAQAAVCGSAGGRHVDVSGCADRFYELNDALAAPPPPQAPNVSVCANVGRRINVSGCI
jgi:hypothetical protein